MNVINIIQKIKNFFIKTDIVIGGEKIDKEKLKKLIETHKGSEAYQLAVTGDRYFRGDHDIRNKKRTAIGENGEETYVKNLPNNKIVDNQYSKMVILKNNYMVGKKITFKGDCEEYLDALNTTLDTKFHRTLKTIGEDSLNAGIGYMYVFYDTKGNLSFKRLKPTEIVPIWADDDHTELEQVIRFYKSKDTNSESVEMVEVYSIDGVEVYQYINGILKRIDYKHYITDESGQTYNWGVLPVIPFKYNSSEVPLIKRLKSLQDTLNQTLSCVNDNMQEDARNSIMVLVNYDGEDLGEFRHNLSTYGVIKVGTTDGLQGDVRTLNVEMNVENYKAVINIIKKAIVENALAYDVKDDRMGGNPNQMNIQSMYSDMDLDANGTELEYQAAMQDVLTLVNKHLMTRCSKDYTKESVQVIFNRDMLINESEAISNCVTSKGLLSDETVLANHPWTDSSELERIKNQRSKKVNDYA